MNYNPREMDDPTYGRQNGNRFSDPMDRERRNGGFGRDAMDSRNQQQGRENRQWGADRYESNPYGNRHVEDRGSENRDRSTQNSTNRNAWNQSNRDHHQRDQDRDYSNRGLSGQDLSSSSNWSNHSNTSYWPDRNDFENRDYSFSNYFDPNADEHDSVRRRELNDSDYGRSSSPDHRLGYENHSRQRYGQSSNNQIGSPSWSERFQNRHFASGDRSRLESGRSSGSDLGGGFNRSYLERGYNDYGTDYRTDANDDRRVYDHGRMMSTQQYERDRNSYGSIPGFGAVGEHYGKGPKGYKRADARIQEEANDALYHDPQIDASEIEISVKDGIVTLTGSVPERRMKRLAEECVERISGVQDVRNQISGGGFFSRLFEGDKSSSASTQSNTSSNTASSTASVKSTDKNAKPAGSSSTSNMM